MPKTVLIAEDRPDSRQLLEDILEQFKPHVRVLVSGDGREALALARTEKPDLAFLDVMMPGLDGVEVCRAIKADPALAGMHVILVTALSQLADFEKDADTGADDCIGKPYDVTLIMERVAAVLGLAAT